MDHRKELILNTIIKEHIKTGTPVGSGVLVEKYKLNISPATARNEMAALEEEEYIAQPYTSAGRIPTEKAYQYYVKNIKEKKLSKNDVNTIKEYLEIKDENNFKKIAKEISQITNSAFFWAFHRNSFYYTGISNLLKQPEFSQIELVHDISFVIDRMEEVVGDLFDQAKSGFKVLIGSHNPFSNYCSSIICKYKYNGNSGLFGILGPMRMDYEKNIALMNFINNKINNYL